MQTFIYWHKAESSKDLFRLGCLRAEIWNDDYIIRLRYKWSY